MYAGIISETETEPVAAVAIRHRSSTWEDQLDPELRGVINAGHQPVPEGPVAHFPHFLTRGQNPGQLIELTPMQVNLLSHLACWTVTSNAARLDTFLR